MERVARKNPLVIQKTKNDMGGISLKGQTPFLLISKEIVEQKSAQFVQFSPKVKTFYSVKANPDPSLLRFIKGLGIGFEIASSSELSRLLGLKVSTKDIISGNPVKAPEFIKYAFKSGVSQFVIDSLDEIVKLAEDAPGAEVIVRIVTDNSESSWPLAEKFGLNPDEAVSLLVSAKSSGLIPKGVTFHVGSQCTGFLSWMEAIKRVSLVWTTAQKNGLELQVLNLGGGFPANHEPQVPEIEDILRYILELTGELLPEKIRLSVEPGRALVGDAGTLITSVIGTARRDGKNWMYLDSGVFNGLMESVGGIAYIFTPISTLIAGETDKWVLAGPSCDSFDVIAREVQLPRLQVGDKLAISPAGAYTSAYASSFNGMRIPRVFLV